MQHEGCEAQQRDAPAGLRDALLLREVFAANEGLLLFCAKVLAEAPYLGIAKLVGGTPARGSS